VSELAGWLMAVALFSIGYLPIQRLKSRRATVIGGIAGLALVPIALALIRSYAFTANTTFAVTVFLFWMIPVGFAMVCGAVVRFYVVSRAALTRRDAWAIAIVCGIGLFILMTALARALMSGLD
jgi:hypothetical protein